MKILILGANGMLGHKLWQRFNERFETYVTFRQSFETYAHFGLFDQARTVDYVSIQNFDSVVRAIVAIRPTVVVNCVGIIKQHLAAKNPLTSISINALFPHRLAQVCQVSNSRLIHFSTDCVFSGRKGNYLASDMADAEDLYGRTKFLGEVSADGCLTLRTSIIGRELATSYGLIEWFLSRQGKSIQGYKKAIFSGFTTQALAEIIAQIITNHPNMKGVWHVAAEPINKFNLLSLVKQVYGLDIQIESNEVVMVDRSLNGEQFRQATGLVTPAWPNMIEQMYQDPTPYSKIRRHHVNR